MQNGSCRFSSAGSVFEIAKFGLCSDQLVFSVLNGKGLGPVLFLEAGCCGCLWTVRNSRDWSKNGDHIFCK